MADFAKLAELSSSGRDANATARRMAAYGFKCKRLRLALKVPMLVDPVGVPVPDLDFSVGPEGNEAFRFVEGEARSMLSDLANLPPMMVSLLGALFANANRYSAKLDGEPAASTFYSVVVSILCHLMGGEISTSEDW